MIRYEWLAEMINENGFVSGAELGGVRRDHLQISAQKLFQSGKVNPC